MRSVIIAKFLLMTSEVLDAQLPCTCLSYGLSNGELPQVYETAAMASLPAGLQLAAQGHLAGGLLVSPSHQAAMGWNGVESEMAGISEAPCEPGLEGFSISTFRALLAAQGPSQAYSAVRSVESNECRWCAARRRMSRARQTVALEAVFIERWNAWSLCVENEVWALLENCLYGLAQQHNYKDFNPIL